MALLNIFDEAYYFNVENEKLYIKHGVVCGLYVNIATGIVKYFMDEEEIEAGYVAKTREEAEAKLEAFQKIRARVQEMQAEIDAMRGSYGMNVNMKERIDSALEKCHGAVPKKTEVTNEQGNVQ